MQEQALAEQLIEAIIAQTRSDELIWKQSDGDSYHTQLDDMALHLTTGRGRSEVTARCGKQVVFQFTHRNKDDRPALSKLRKVVRSANVARTAKMRGTLSKMGIPTEDRSEPTTAAFDGAATTETAPDVAPPGGEGQ